MSEYRQKTITPVEGVTITVRETIGMDAIDQSALYPDLNYDRTSRKMRGRASRFTEAVTRTVSAEGLPFAWADGDAKDAALQAAFEGWQALPNNIVVPWANALLDVDRTVDPNVSAPPTSGASSPPSIPSSLPSEPTTSE